MDRNLFLAVGLSVLIYMGWFKFIEKRYPVAQPRAVPAASQPGAPSGPNAAPNGEPPIAVTVGGVALAVQPMGAGLASFQYPDASKTVDLVYSRGSALLSTFPELKFRQVGGAAFEAELPSGVKVLKEFRIDGPDKMHVLRMTLTNPGKAPATVADWSLFSGPGLGTVPSEEKENGRMLQALALLKAPEGKKVDPLLRVKPKADEQSHPEPWRWLGLNNRYFLLALFPPAERFSSFETGATEENRVRAPWVKVRAAPLTLAPGQSASFDVPFYLGPKSYPRLRQLNLGLERSIDFGWFDPIGRASLKTLRLFHDWTGNWGWAILLLTFCVQIILFPMTYGSLKSAAAMRRVQPEMARLQQQFGKDPQRLNREMLELYKKHGANPMGGCLPMLAQMPIVVALYNMIRNAWELHGAPWILWIRDLSAHDPFYVLPLVMGGMMFLQTKANPAPTADPAQAQVMQFMPIMFTFMFLKVPAGLVLYWLTSSVLNFGQQTALKSRFAGSK